MQIIEKLKKIVAELEQHLFDTKPHPDAKAAFDKVLEFKNAVAEHFEVIEKRFEKFLENAPDSVFEEIMGRPRDELTAFGEATNDAARLTAKLPEVPRA